MNKNNLDEFLEQMIAESTSSPISPYKRETIETPVLPNDPQIMKVLKKYPGLDLKSVKMQIISWANRGGSNILGKVSYTDGAARSNEVTLNDRGSLDLKLSFNVNGEHMMFISPKALQGPFCKSFDKIVQNKTNSSFDSFSVRNAPLKSGLVYVDLKLVRSLFASITKGKSFTAKKLVALNLSKLKAQQEKSSKDVYKKLVALTITEFEKVIPVTESILIKGEKGAGLRVTKDSTQTIILADQGVFRLDKSSIKKLIDILK